MLNLEQLRLQYVTDEAGKKTAVILPIAEFKELVGDINDLAVVAERRGESTISHDSLVTELKRNELI